MTTTAQSIAENVAVRRHWMKLIGVTHAETEIACQAAQPLEDELAQLREVVKSAGIECHMTDSELVAIALRDWDISAE